MEKVKEEMKIAQESWVITRISESNYYDTNGNPADEILYAGDCTITLQGGHNYKSLEENTLVYEFKSGPMRVNRKIKYLYEKNDQYGLW